MKCKVCGREIRNEEANFCEYCGTSFREQYRTEVKPEPREQYNLNSSGHMPAMMQMPNQRTDALNTESSEKPVSFLNWLGTYGILIIPFVGWIVFFVMLFVWAFGGTTPPSKKNWARVTLIFIGILIIVIFFYMISIISNPAFSDFMNGNMDFNTFYQNFYGNTK